MQLLKVVVCSIFLCTISCARTPALPKANQFSAPPPPDYATSANWAALPTKADNADQTPGPELQDQQANARADVFYIHPTMYNKVTDWSDDWNATLYDPQINERVDDKAILNQASIFNAAGRVFAPRYRQAHFKVYYKKGQPVAKQALDLAYEDVLRAFDFYLNHYNQGRPIIIASHSQGTTHTKRLLNDRFDGQPLRHQLVAAYLVGMPVSEDAYQTIPVCKSPRQTGCFVSWRTYRNDFKPRPGYRDTVPNIAVVNPLTWTTDPGVAPATLNQGGVLLNYDRGPVPELVSAEIRGAALFTSKPRFFGSIFFGTKNYHIGDYNLFWMNVRENAVERVGAFLQNED